MSDRSRPVSTSLLKTYQRILANGRDYRGRFGLSFAFLILFNLFGAVSLALVIPFLEILFSNPTAAATPQVAPATNELKSWGYYYLNNAIMHYGKLHVLAGFCVFLATATILKSTFRYLSLWTIAVAEHGIARRIRQRVLEHLTQMPLQFFAFQKRGKINNLLLQDVQVVQDGIIGTVSALLSNPLTMIFYLTAMLIVSWQLTLFTLIVIPITGIFINTITRSLKRNSLKGQAQLDKLAAAADEFIGGIRIVKAFSAEAAIRKNYAALNQEYTDTIIKIRRRMDLASPVNEVLIIFVILALIYYGGSLILSQSSATGLKASEFIGFIGLFSQFVTPVKVVTDALSRVQKAAVSYLRIEELLNTPTDSIQQTPATPITFKDRISFQSVTFRYTPQSPPVLDQISFEIRKGHTVALVGPSGSGKSTLLDLLCRFYDPTNGNITLDHIDYRQLSPAALHQLMGIVTQESILFHDTIAENIAFGRPATREQIINAARIAHAHDFICQLPEGYDTVIGERGARLSGGQRQRIAIARAVFANPAIIILDEATSALDSESERLVQAALEALSKDRTVIIVAHRLSTIRHADRILVLKQGRIVETGTHAHLLAAKGEYARLYHLQFSQPSAS